MGPHMSNFRIDMLKWKTETVSRGDTERHRGDICWVGLDMFRCWHSAAQNKKNKNNLLHVCGCCMAKIVTPSDSCAIAASYRRQWSLDMLAHVGQYDPSLRIKIRSLRMQLWDIANETSQSVTKAGRMGRRKVLHFQTPLWYR